jgi:predicted CDP-diglyceride synthetase/phosphatidate cytidylyltransferase
MLTEQKMDDLIKMVKGFAPGIATALGGPLAGMAVSALSKQLGVKDEVDAVMKAINKDPEAENAPLLNKIVTPALALGVTGLSFVLFAVLIFVEVKPEAKDILIYILGVLSAAVTQILSYYFGSSMGSKDKGDQLRSAVK